MTLFRVRGKTALEICIIISLLSPPFIGAYSWILIGGRSGILTQWLQTTFHYEFPSIYGFSGILLVLTLKLYPFIYLYAAGAMKSIDGHWWRRQRVLAAAVSAKWRRSLYRSSHRPFSQVHSWCS